MIDRRRARLAQPGKNLENPGPNARNGLAVPPLPTPSRLRAAGLAGAAVLALAGCAPAGGGREPGVGIAFDLVEAPAAFDLEGVARRPDRDAPGGYWAVVPGLPRAESAVVRRAGGTNGKAVTVALFRAPRGQPAGEIILSEAAAAALGVADAPVRVRVTAVREEPELVFTANRF